MPSVTRGTLPGVGVFLSSFLRLSLRFCFFPFSSIPFHRALSDTPRLGIYFLTYVAPSIYLPPDCLSPSPPFILEMGAGIHETKLMITTSKQRAERPTATCPAIHMSHHPPPLLPSHFYRIDCVLQRSMSLLFLFLFPFHFFGVDFLSRTLYLLLSRDVTTMFPSLSGYFGCPA